MKSLGKIIKKSVLPMNAPSFILKTTLGELADILLNGSRVSSTKIIENGYQFQYKTLEQALKEINN